MNPIIDAVLNDLTTKSALTAQESQSVKTQIQMSSTPLATCLFQQLNVKYHQCVAKVIAAHFHLPYIDLTGIDENKLLNIKDNPLPIRVMVENEILPLYHQNNQLWVAIYDPIQQQALNIIQWYTALPIRFALTSALLLQQRITRIERQADHQSGLLSQATDSHIVRLVRDILLESIQKGASDVHFEPYEHYYRIRMRIDGLLYEMAQPQLQFAQQIVARIKVMAHLDISEKHLPQDGRFTLETSDQQAHDFRVSICPLVTGEKIVIRLLDPKQAQIGVDYLGMHISQKSVFMDHINASQGLVLVTGPTGSGKTVTLYTALNQLNSLDRNITTIEDPVEIWLSGINQVTINRKINRTFANSLRTFLRQDPDVMMVGEMRDLETTELAIKAAQTGHLVLSTLHTNSATETITRLTNMGVPNYNIATSVSLIIAQRLLRRLCPYCQYKTVLSRDTLRQFNIASHQRSFPVYEANQAGCQRCQNGFRGRIGIFEMLDIDDAMKQLILAGNDARELQAFAEQRGMLTLRQHGLYQIKQGLTSLTELNRVTTT